MADSRGVDLDEKAITGARGDGKRDLLWFRSAEMLLPCEHCLFGHPGSGWCCEVRSVGDGIGEAAERLEKGSGKVSVSL